MNTGLQVHTVLDHLASLGQNQRCKNNRAGRNPDKLPGSGPGCQTGVRVEGNRSSVRKGHHTDETLPERRCKLDARKEAAGCSVVVLKTAISDLKFHIVRVINLRTMVRYKTSHCRVDSIFGQTDNPCQRCKEDSPESMQRLTRHLKLLGTIQIWLKNHKCLRHMCGNVMH